MIASRTPDKRAARYQYLARPLNSTGCGRIVVPIDKLFSSGFHEFLAQTMEQLAGGTALDSSTQKRIIEDCGFSNSVFRFADYTAILSNHIGGRGSSLEDIAARLEDLLNDDGRWFHEGTAVCNELLKDSHDEVAKSLERLIYKVLTKHGPASARQIVESVENGFRNAQLDTTNVRSELSQSAIDELRELVSRVESLRQRQKSWRRFLTPIPILSRFSAQPSRDELDRVTRRIAQAELDLRLARTNALMSRFYSDSLKDILGNDEQIGLLANARKNINSVAQKLSNLAQEFRQSASFQASCLPNEILIVDSVYDYTSDGRSVKQVLMDQMKNAGCIPEHFARQLKQGVSVNERRFYPHQYDKVTEETLKRILRQLAENYLGSIHDPIDIEHPKRAVDFIAQLHLSHPCWSSALKSAVGQLCTRSHPYLAIESGFAGFPITTECYLFAHQNQMELLQNLVSTHAEVSNDDSDGRFHLDTPFVCELVQNVLCAPASVDLAQWIHRHRSLVADGEIESLYFTDSREFRALSHRPQSKADCRSVLKAAMKARFVIEMSNGKLAISYVDFELEGIFRKLNIVPIQRLPTFFEKAIHERWFADLLRGAFSDLLKPGDSWDEKLIKLGQHMTPSALANELVDLGVLTEVDVNQFELTRVPIGPRRFPQLFEVEIGELVGLSADEFLVHLLDNDWLYNVVFWRGVIDPLSDKRLTFSDLPDHAREIARKLSAD